MAERTNRRDEILDAASRLFMEKGYTSTSVREIADAVGCTEAALYYHFKEGKRELLQAVAGLHTPHLDKVLEACHAARSLTEMVQIFEQTFRECGPETLTKARWYLGEFHRLTPDERSIAQQKWLRLQSGLAELIEHFVDDPERANHLAWLMVVTTFGYGMLFYNFDLRSIADFQTGELADLLIDLLSDE